MLVALVIAVGLVRVVTGVARTGGVPSAVGQLLLADAAVWLPLVAGTLWVLRGRGWSRAVARLGLRFSFADVLAAAGIAVLCRAVDASLSLGFFGTTGLVPQASLGGGPDVLVLLVTVLGTCLVSSVVEEVFFRGLFQRALASALPHGARFLAVLVTAGLFAIAHVLIGNTTSSLAGLEVFVTTFVLGALVGTLVALTGRIGGAILAHVLFNAIAVALTWPV